MPTSAATELSPATRARRRDRRTWDTHLREGVAQRGFTLLEVLLVLAIIGLAGALLVPRLGDLDSRGFDVEVRSVANLLNHARRNAVVTGNPSTISFLPEIEDEEFNYNPPVFSAGVYQARNIELQFQNSTGASETVLEPLEIIFFPEGGSTGGALLLLQRGDRANRGARIDIDPFTGRINANETQSIR